MGKYGMIVPHLEQSDMDLNELLLELFGRVTEHIHEAVDGLEPESLVAQPLPQ